MRRERTHNDQVKEFFGNLHPRFENLSCELKDSSRKFARDLANSHHAKIVTRLVKDTVRLEIATRELTVFGQFAEQALY